MKTDKFADYKKGMPKDYDQKIKLSDTMGMVKLIAPHMIKEYGFYMCMIGDKKTVVIP